MKRLLLNQLNARDGEWFEGDQPYTGVGFQIAPDRTVRAFEFSDGMRTGLYRPLCALGKEPQLQVDMTGQIEPYRLAMFQGSPLEGVGYTFDQGFCDSECFYNQGTEGSQVTWQKDGTMLECLLGGDAVEFGESYAWFNDSKLKSFLISTSHSFYARLTFNESGHLRFLVLRRGFLKNLAAIRAQVHLKPVQVPIERDEDLVSFRAAEKMTIMGDDIDGRLLEWMVKGGVFEKTAELEIGEAPNLKTLSMLAVLPNLTKLALDNMDDTQRILAEQLQRIRPALYISFNRTDLTIPIRRN